MRFYEFSILKEAEARIHHAEDVVFWEGSRGAVRAVESLKQLEQGGHKDVTIKWDGSPAIIFGLIPILKICPVMPGLAAPTLLRLK